MSARTLVANLLWVRWALSLASCAGPLILNGGYDRISAEEAIYSDATDAVAFGTSFIANPDLVGQMRQDLPLNAPDPDTFYTEGVAGYTDYPRHAAAA